MNHELTATNILTLFIADKSQLDSFVDKVLESVNEGQIDALKALIGLKGMEKIASTLTDRSQKTNKRFEDAKMFLDLVMQEADLHPKTFQYQNCKFEKKEVGTKYDYSLCNDSK